MSYNTYGYRPLTNGETFGLIFLLSSDTQLFLLPDIFYSNSWWRCTSKYKVTVCFERKWLFVIDSPWLWRLDTTKKCKKDTLVPRRRRVKDVINIQRVHRGMSFCSESVTGRSRKRHWALHAYLKYSIRTRAQSKHIPRLRYVDRNRSVGSLPPRVFCCHPTFSFVGSTRIVVIWRIPHHSTFCSHRGCGSVWAMSLLGECVKTTCAFSPGRRNSRNDRR